MPKDGALLLRDIVGKLDVLRIECEKCGRRGQYRVDRLVGQHGPDFSLMDFRLLMTKNCPRRIRNDYNAQCAAVMPDLPALFDR